jgi:glycosyltransferase involved in cell wall biosynthesis
MYWAVRIAERCTLALADVVIATNQSVLRAVKQRGKLRDDRAFVVRTAPNRMNTAVAPDESLRSGKKHLVGYVGVMGNADGVDYLVRAADHIIKTRQRTDVQFLLMGSGPEHAELLALRDRLGLQDHISMPGRVSDEFLCRGLRTIDLGVACDPINAYNDHCTMNKVLEYMAFAKPIVMFGTVEGRFSAGDGAVYVMDNSAEKLGDAILELLDDEKRRQTLAAAGHARLTQELNWDRSVEQLVAAYKTTQS